MEHKAVENEYQQIVGLLHACAAQEKPDPGEFQQAMLRWFRLEGRESFPDPVLRVWASPANPELLTALPPTIKLYVLNAIHRENLKSPHDILPLLSCLTDTRLLSNVQARFHPPFHYLRIASLLLAGEREEAARLHREQSRALSGYGVSGWIDWSEGKDGLKAFNRDLSTLRRREQNPNACFTGVEGLVHILALLEADNHRHLKSIRGILDNLEQHQPHNHLLPAYRIFRGVIAILENQPITARNLLKYQKQGREQREAPAREHALGLILLAQGQKWLNGSLGSGLNDRLEKVSREFQQASMCWPAKLGMELLRGGNPLDIIPARAPWHQALLAMEHRPALEREEAQAPSRRLSWLFEADPESFSAGIKAVIQHRNDNGRWSKGRPPSRRRLAGLAPLSTGNIPLEMDHRDQLLRAELSKIPPHLSGGYLEINHFDSELLVDHPRLFLAARPEIRVKLEWGRPVLYLEEEKNGSLRLRLEPCPTAAPVMVLPQGLAEFKLIKYTPEQRNLAATLGPHGLLLPKSEALDILQQGSGIPPGVTVLSQIEEIFTTPAPQWQPPDNRPILQLLPAGSGLRLRLRVRPLGPKGPCLPPGRGPLGLRTEIEQSPRHVRRELAQERQRVQVITSILEQDRFQEALKEEDFTWFLPNPALCLEFLAQAEEITPPVTLEWPEGEGFSLSPTIGVEQLHLRISRRNNWFALSGELRLDQGLVLELEHLLRASRSGHGRFVDLGHGRFLTLSRSLRRRLDEISALGEIEKHQVKLHPLAARMLAEGGIEEEDNPDGTSPSKKGGPHLDGDQGWQNFLRSIQQAEEGPQPLPDGLEAQLRSYQKEGYQWLQHLARLELGACLADDMGLGKTVQALALILARSKGGPSLVVAPTSVVANWIDEAARFTPSLRLRPFQGGRNEKERAPEPGELIVCSYNRLQRDSAWLAGHRWQTIVLDEAQAIKNLLAKRSRAAMKLEGDFKLITTGTPLENNMGELWALFQFINPGLLGSFNHFNRHFIIPIEQHQDEQALLRLRKLLTPFVLRRLKSEVVQELPPRTEITLKVSMGREESAMYEALRRQAVEGLHKGRESKGAPFQVLAQIMKLRRACCHPRLVLPETTLPGAKLELFAKLIGELLENRHRILVFSQFVDHLAVIRELLQQRKISYQYLDGATPAVRRRQQVNDFQRGKGDIFLISLRAGGVGLNLTAADYVIHLDPWWNPAVEDQASDRVHRIGQEKPVTIYRLITSGTIEEKIQELHHHKRKLAADLINIERKGPPRSHEELLALLS